MNPKYQIFSLRIMFCEKLAEKFGVILDWCASIYENNCFAFKEMSLEEEDEEIYFLHSVLHYHVGIA